MKKELVFMDDINAKDYLMALLVIYPYDIEERMVLSLLDHPRPHIVLMNFLRYVQTIHKIHLMAQDICICDELNTLFLTMSHLLPSSGSLFHPHHFAFDATMLYEHYSLIHPYAHLPLSDVLFIKEIRTHNINCIPMHKQKFSTAIEKSTSFIFRNISITPSCFVALRIRIADKNGIVFLSRECLSFAIALTALYPLQTNDVNYDFLLIFGLKDETNRSVYYYDETNSLYIGLVCGDFHMLHFLHLKDMLLTLYNSICIKKHDLPIHASMIQIHFPDMNYGIVFAGDHHSGKSEMLDAIAKELDRRHIFYDKLYDDSGILHYLDNAIVSTGSEVGACKDITFMRKESIFQVFLNSVFLKEEDTIKYQITPLTTHETSVQFHNVNMLVYLNPALRSKKLHTLTLQEALFRYTSTIPSYFCGSLGTTQQPLETEVLIRDFLTILHIQNMKLLEAGTYGTSFQKQTLFNKIVLQILHAIPY